MTVGKVFAMSLEDLTKRVTTLEAHVGVTHQTATAALALAAGTDRDVADLRAELRGHTRVLGALRETQLEQGQILAQHGQILAQHDAKLNDIVGLLNHLIDRDRGQD